MKARITKDGLLELQRVGVWRRQDCREDREHFFCNHTCPAFFECDPSNTVPQGKLYLQLRCMGEHTEFEIVEDARERKHG